MIYFVYDIAQYYPSGGLDGDLEGVYRSKEEAIEVAENLKKIEWVVVYEFDPKKLTWQVIFNK